MRWLEIEVRPCGSGDLLLSAGRTLRSIGRLHIQANEDLYLNAFGGGGTVIVGGGGPGNFHVDGHAYVNGGIGLPGNFGPDGTVGQPDAGTLSGGGYLLDSGFWSALVEEALPHLEIRLQGNQVMLSWPMASTGFELQEAPALGSGSNWSNVSATPMVNGSNMEVTLPVLPGSRCFRLHMR